MHFLCVYVQLPCSQLPVKEEIRSENHYATIGTLPEDLVSFPKTTQQPGRLLNRANGTIENRTECCSNTSWPFLAENSNDKICDPPFLLVAGAPKQRAELKQKG
ncbi:hypothetical protein BaRGS_00003842 [Batillaria attramentaria]|uniref:Uncharacterized protein n=1 Tax=Batillaria attramentaria TaxID=370345 RepID=A0ABD0LYL6_9CAEN